MSTAIKVDRSASADPNGLDHHAHSYNEVLTLLDTKEKGLTVEEVESRRKRYGYNRFTQGKTVRWYERVFDQLRSPLAFVLVVAFFVTLALREYIDAGVISFALFIAVVVGVLQEGRASNAFKKLAASQVKLTTVIRDGVKHEIVAEELVPGDMVVLQSGFMVPADMRLCTVKQLSINEASLTGESLPIKKQVDPVASGTTLAERASMAWMGTYVASGHGTGVVVATGDKTQFGQLAGSVREIEDAETPLQHETNALSQLLIFVIGGLVLMVFAIGLIQGQTLHDMLLMSIAVAVASVPEGLPAAVTIILAVGMEALLKRGGLVRNLLAAETMGSTTYVLTDKTGTLTEAKMKITGVLVEDGSYVPMGQIDDYSPGRDLLENALAASDAYFEMTEKGKVEHGDPVERAILTAAFDRDISESKDSWRAARIDYLSFTSEQRFAAGLVPAEEGNVLAMNGSPELFLPLAESVVTQDGIVRLTETVRHDIKEAIANQTSAGKRLVAVGYKRVSYDSIPAEEENIMSGLILAGILILDDPVRAGVPKAVAGVQSAGARVVLITGDNAKTALSIAVAVGIAREGDVALSGSDLNDLTDEELIVALREVTVFARVLPQQKMRIATVLQKQGEIVAMTGDGVNDAPALRRANIGIALGSGTEVAKEAADLILMNDSLETMYAAIEEGRRIVANLRKIVGYLLATSLSEVVLIAAALITGGAAPILPAQILWANVIEEGLMSVAFAFEKGDKNAMRRKPQDVHAEGLISADMSRFILFTILVFGALIVSLYFYLRSLNLPLADLRSLMFLAVATDSLFIAFSFRSLTTPLWRIPLYTNRFFIGSFLVSFMLFAIVLTVPFFQLLLSYEPQPWSLIMWPMLVSVATLLSLEIGKWLFFERQK